jgi:hypothetical protein
MVETQLQSADQEAELFKQIQHALRGLRFGSVEIVVHDSRVVQLERRERFRFDKALDQRKGGNSHGV